MNYKLLTFPDGDSTTLQAGDRIVYDLTEYLIFVKRGHSRLHFEGPVHAKGGYHTGKLVDTPRAGELLCLIAEFAAATVGLSAEQVHEEASLGKEVIFELRSFTSS